MLLYKDNSKGVRGLGVRATGMNRMKQSSTENDQRDRW
jgi:hypothetical protein